MASIAKNVVTPQKRMRGLPIMSAALMNAKAPLAGGAFYAMFIAFVVGLLYPTLSSLNLSSYLASRGVQSLLGTGNVKIHDFSSFSALIALELYGSFYGLLFGSLVAYIAGAALPLTIENGTLDLALSRPMSRTRYYFELWASTIVGGILLSTLTIGAIWLCTLFVKNTNIDWQWLTITQLIEFAFFFFVAGIGMLLSTFLNASRAAGGAAVGIVFLAYVMNTLGGLSDKFKWLLKIEPFYYTPGVQALVLHDFTRWYPWVLVGAGLVCGFVGLIIFNKKDLPTV